MVDVLSDRVKSLVKVSRGGMVVIEQALAALRRGEAQEGEVVKKATPSDWARRKRRRVRDGTVVGGRRKNAGGIATGEREKKRLRGVADDVVDNGWTGTDKFLEGENFLGMVSKLLIETRLTWRCEMTH